MAGKIAGLAAAIAVMVSAAPAMACYGGCSQGFNFGTNYGYGCGVAYSGCGASVGYGYAYREHLPDPTGPYSNSGPQYYYVNQGPTFTGPGDVAPAPTYQERAVGGWYVYSRPYYYGYNGGPYANTTNHLYDGAYGGGPAVYSYRRHHYYRTNFRSRPRAPKYYYTGRPGVRYGYDGPRNYGERQRVF
ncbi:MAG: hypothetical protein K2X60_10365 [Xanthobacteraceae bacterium]|nr:hypothetical protein [Xanthobacteraceae bacterium]